jgi:formate dehydrogenase subunit gamma
MEDPMAAPAVWDVDRARTVVRAHAELRGALLPVLHALQEAFGYIDEQAIPIVAETLNLSKADVHGVVSFYHDFRRSPTGRHVIKLCRAEACQAMGSDALADHVEQHLAVGMGGTTADGAFSLKPVFCLGNCALSPAVMVDDHLYGRVNPRRFDQIIAAERKHEAAE